MSTLLSRLCTRKAQQSTTPYKEDVRLELLHEKDSIHDWEPIRWRTTDNIQRVAMRNLNSKKQRYQIEENQTYETIPFSLGGNRYQNLSDLRMNTVQEEVWCPNDCGIPDVVALYHCQYGHTVMYIKEHFPCYDHYDRLYDKRFDHYYYVFNGKNLSLFRYADTAKDFFVTDDIGKIHWRHLRKMKEYNAFPFVIIP